jgi:hypothetical protein
VKRIFELPEVVTALKNVGGEPAPMSPDEFAAVHPERTAEVEGRRQSSGVQID